MDAANFLTITLILVALILLGVGVYLIILLREAHHSLRRINRLLDRTESIMNFVEDKFIRPASSVGTFASLLREALVFFADVKKAVDKRKDADNA